MTKHEMIDFLIDNEDVCGWSEEGRATLEALSEGGLKRMTETVKVLVNAKEDMEDEEETPPKKGKKAKPTKNAASPDGDDIPDNDDGEDVETDLKGKKKKGKNGRITNMFQQPKTEEGEDTVTNEESEVTMNEYLEKAPPQMQEVLRGGIAVFNQKKKSLVEMIFNHDNNTGNFTKQWLSEQKIELLEGMARLIGNGKKRQANYAGAAAGTPSAPMLQNGHKVAPLVAPRMTFNDRRLAKK